MLDILLPSLLLIALGAAFHSVVHQASSRGRSKSELPIHHRTTSPWVIERHGLSVSVTTTGLNGLPSQLFDVRKRNRLKAGLLLFYDIGVIVGVVGGIVAIGATIWQLVQIWGTVWVEVQSHAAEKGEVGLVKRILPRDNMAASTPALQGLQPLVSPAIQLQQWPTDGQIPGVTLPLRHLPTLILALVVNQLIHELGHALSAAVCVYSHI
jgi:S2P endopeptidase